jgi:hypothetical protein
MLDEPGPSYLIPEDEIGRVVITPPRVIEEHGISQITLDNGYENEEYEPKDGYVKWFRDELGQTWAKFYTEHIHEGEIQTLCQVWPAAAVTVVEYPKET